ncbi:hypothetical protein SAY86_020805 [Trapa natans]|uniref:WRKY domain-containing protein n=1 Tax=Trapa natans TaxID=22666 RepID=A0AAN7MY21_TRANT|nr:hypothetical protein SAY86_020805 [Trapa natans]
MSDEPRDLYNNCHNPYQYGNLGYDPSSYMSFTDCLRGPTVDYESLARAFGLSPDSSDLISLPTGNPTSVFDARERGGPTSECNNDPAAPNSTISSSYTEAGAEEDSCKSKPRESQTREESERSTKQSKLKKKAEKKQPRFAFMTKSEVDHLEDGYRWRKYGQKAVKNSSYPRSYYRCTTQKCTVKKRVERSFQDPSIVVTTYEGQHNHPIPSTIRGNSAAVRFTSSSMLNPSSEAAALGPSFAHDSLLNQINHSLCHNQGGGTGGSGGTGYIYPEGATSHQQQHQQQYSDYGIYEDMVHSMYYKMQEL